MGGLPRRCLERLGNPVTGGVIAECHQLPRLVGFDQTCAGRRSPAYLAASSSAQYLPVLRSPPAIRASPPFPRAQSMYDRVARHSESRFHPRAKKSRSNFPRFDFSKCGNCARAPFKTPPETHSRFRRGRARISQDFPRLPRGLRFLASVSTPEKRCENENRRFPQSTCTWRATNRRSLKHASRPLAGRQRSTTTRRGADWL